MDDNLKLLAEREEIGAAFLEREIREGRAVVLKHKDDPAAVLLGAGVSTKLNTNLGISLASDLQLELEKLRVAEHHGTDTVMDLSTNKTHWTLERMVEASRVPVGTVPIYGAFANPTEDGFLNEIAAHIKLGASYCTIHAAITREGSRQAIKRVTKIVSRGGGILAAYMQENDCENPLYTNFDYILELFKDTGVAISLGDALRPGCLADANDQAQLMELKVQGELVLRARKAGVPVFCEGPGHMPMDTIAENAALQKRICHGAPYYVLGPLVTDTALGYDHINAAIGAAIAAQAGVEFLCVLTPQEHYSLPTLEGIRDGVIAYRIAAHSADLLRKKGLWEQNRQMSQARFDLNWTEQNRHSITRIPVETKDHQPCSMCLGLCPMLKVSQLMKGEAGNENLPLENNRRTQMKEKVAV
ncbi:MAG: phosphomethylpyrimidine synthase ThiC [Candidatus Micrarchaeota archaeon]